MRFVALIPARGGSKRIPRKNLELIGPYTLVALAIRAAQASGVIDNIFVSTDDPAISAEALKHGALVLDRPSELAADETPMEDVVRHYISPFMPDDVCVVLLEPTAALRTPANITLAVEVMRVTLAPAVRLVSPEPSACHDATYRDAGLASVIRVGAFRTGTCLFPRGTILIHSGDEHAVDIDTPADLERARALALSG